MSLGSWDPQAGAAAAQVGITPELLERFAQYSRNEQLDQLDTLLTGDEPQVFAGLMKLPTTEWLSVAADLDDAQLLDLIRFFAVAENLPGWEAGAESPVISLAKVLRKRGTRLEKTLLAWLRKVNDNRFLPYGPL